MMVEDFMMPILKKRKILVIAIVILFVLSLNFFQREVRGFFYSISAPVQKIFWQAGDRTSDFFEAIFEAKNLKRENKELNLEIQELLFWQNFSKELEEENRTLREALRLGLQKEFRLESAEIIGKDINRDTVLIDKGFKDGISKDLPVITGQKVLVGNIAEVFQNYSRVLLISDEESSLEARVSVKNISGLVKGLGSSKIFLDLIPKDEEIKEGDLVISGGFLVGLISRVRQIDVNSFQQAEISPFLEISSLKRVFIVLDY